MRRHLLFLLTAFSLSGCIHRKDTAKTENLRFNDFKDRFIVRLWQLNPTWAMLSGYHNYDKLDNRLRMLSKRLEKVPEYYAVAKHNIKDPTPEHTDLAILQNKGAISVFENMLQDSLKKSGLSQEEKIEISVKADVAKKT